MDEVGEDEARIRARVLQMEADKAHVCTSVTCSPEELTAMMAERRERGYCTVRVLGEDGRLRGAFSGQCTGIYDDDWAEDVPVLLAEINRLRAERTL